MKNNYDLRKSALIFFLLIVFTATLVAGAFTQHPSVFLPVGIFLFCALLLLRFKGNSLLGEGEH